MTFTFCFSENTFKKCSPGVKEPHPQPQLSKLTAYSELGAELMIFGDFGDGSAMLLLSHEWSVIPFMSLKEL